MSINKMERKAVCEVCSSKSDCLNEVGELNICKNIPLSEALSILCKEPILFICTTCSQLIEGEYIQKCLNIKIKDEPLESCCFDEDAHMQVKLEEIYNGILKSENLENTFNQKTLERFSDLTNESNENVSRINDSHDDTLVTNCAVNNVTQCERQFKNSNGIVYDTIESLNCIECNKSFNNKRSLNKHIKQIHDYTLIKFNECNKIFYNTIYFKHHMRNVHDTTRPVKCNECHKIFKIKYLLKTHMKKVHVTSEPMKCNKCNKIFKNRIYFKIHLRRIHDISPVKCNDCNKMFKSKEKLRCHINNIHVTTTTPMKCNECNKIFKNKYLLKEHVKKVHVTTEPMKCNKCNKIYKNTTFFKLHLERVHDEVTATCNICNQFFKNNYRLSVHKKRIHVRTISLNIEDL